MKNIKCTGCQQEYNSQDILNKKYLRFFGDGHSMTFTFHPECEEDAIKIIDNKFLAEEYKNHKIYLIDGKYIPYAGCAYYFNSLEDCKKRIDKGIAIFASGQLSKTISKRGVSLT